jgi:nitroreductase
MSAIHRSAGAAPQRALIAAHWPPIALHEPCSMCMIVVPPADYGACSAAVQNFMLYLWKAGVGSKWTSGDITRDARFFDIVGIDEAKEFVVGLIWFGYPKLTPTQQRAGLETVLTELP